VSAVFQRGGLQPRREIGHPGPEKLSILVMPASEKSNHGRVEKIVEGRAPRKPLRCTKLRDLGVEWKGQRSQLSREREGEAYIKGGGVGATRCQEPENGLGGNGRKNEASKKKFSYRTRRRKIGLSIQPTRGDCRQRGASV